MLDLCLLCIQVMHSEGSEGKLGRDFYSFLYPVTTLRVMKLHKTSCSHKATCRTVLTTFKLLLKDSFLFNFSYHFLLYWI